MLKTQNAIEVNELDVTNLGRFGGAGLGGGMGGLGGGDGGAGMAPCVIWGITVPSSLKFQVNLSRLQ